MKADLNNYWTTRRTIREFTDQPVADETIKSLLEKAAHAPTTGNMQLYSVIITRDPEMKERLVPAHFRQPASVNAPVLLTFCADFNRFVKWCEASGAEPGFNNLQSFMSALLDTAILAQQFVTLAELAGLGTCYLGTTTYNAPMIAEVLGLPSMVVPITTIALGYPSNEGSVSDRIPVEAFIHSETYREETPEEVRERYYTEKEALAESARFVAENGKQTLAQVFTDVRYPRASNEASSESLEKFIREAFSIK